MEVRQLEMLRELADRGSITAVAEALFVTPSAVSQQLAALQRRIPVPLTERRGRAIVLTDAGRALATAATDVAAAMARAQGAVDAFLDNPATTVRIAAFHSAAQTLFPRLLATVDTGSTPIECSDEDVAQTQFPALSADYDIVVAHRPLHGAPWPAPMTVVPLLHEPLDVALPAGHRLARRPAVTAADVAAEPWIAVHEGFPLLATIDAIAAAAGRPIRIVHRINDFAVASAVVAAGGGLALLPRYTSPRHPGTVLRRLRGVPAGRRIDLLARRDRAARRPVAGVIHALERIATELTSEFGAPDRLAPRGR